MGSLDLDTLHDHGAALEVGDNVLLTDEDRYLLPYLEPIQEIDKVVFILEYLDDVIDLAAERRSVALEKIGEPEVVARPE